VIDLKRIVLKGFKSIREMDLELGHLNILIGANGAGKSNFISFFTLVNQIVSGHLQLHVGKSGGADPLLHFGRKRTDRLYCRLEFSESDYEFTLVPAAGAALIFAGEQWRMPGGEIAEGGAREGAYTTAPAGYPETTLQGPVWVHSAEGIEFARKVMQNLPSWRVYHFHDTSDTAKVKQFCDVHDNRFLRSDAANLASVLYLIKKRHPEHYRNIIDSIRLVAPFFDDFDLEPSPLNTEKIRLQWRERGADTFFGPDVTSDGTLRFICLVTLLLQPELPSLVLIDEPELGLHPAAITLVASLLKSASTRTQVIACTQSVTLVNQFEPADIVVVDREEGESKFGRLPEEGFKDWMEDYGLGDLWEKNVIGGRLGL
jgi:predicted ATPase